MENIERHCITIEELDSDNESSIRSTKVTEDSIDDAFVVLMQKCLEDLGGSKIQISETRSSVCIFRAPQSFREISSKAAIYPEMVSIGPYHHGKDQAMGVDLRQLMKAMKGLESEARSCYSEPIPMSRKDFIEMMVLDGCFIVELLHQVCGSQGSENANIPIIMRDLLKLENQLPLFVLQKLYDFSIGNVSAYIAFMSCLINSARDVTCICDDGIIASSSYNDLRVAHLFKKLRENVEFNIRDLYLYKQFRDVEAYYRSH
ncbi:putative UPF0481 protein At3g02645 [Camellia sinensis]|uniref:putative UPF0481 protein At3g02645 n=1 Tax=Camellia sinensis TaxID=4442 RepID=UPI001035FAA4|nr:putative UPF0481 protein At3g02645 [Camellia sinensis]